MRALARIAIRGQLTEAEKELSRIAYERGVDGAGFARIRSKGDAALFGGHTTADMKKRLGVKGSRPLADHLPSVTLAAKQLADVYKRQDRTCARRRGSRAAAAWYRR